MGIFEKRSDALYQYLERAIVEGSLRSGARLPPERELAEQFSLSRSSVREALLALKARGWIASKQGGGHYVTQQLDNEIAKPILTILNHNPEAHFDFLEFRHSVEGDCAYNAALRATEPDLVALASAFAAMQRAHKAGNIEKEAEADARFHTVIAEASHNLLFLHVIKSFHDVLQANMLSSINQFFTHDIAREDLMRQHSAIYDAIVNRQPATAKEAMQAHIRYLQQLLTDFEREQARRERALRRQQSLEP